MSMLNSMTENCLDWGQGSKPPVDEPSHSQSSSLNPENGRFLEMRDSLVSDGGWKKWLLIGGVRGIGGAIS